MERDSAQEQYDKMTKTPVHQLVLRLVNRCLCHFVILFLCTVPLHMCSPGLIQCGNSPQFLFFLP